jgi:hypothetical protein
MKAWRESAESGKRTVECGSGEGRERSKDSNRTGTIVHARSSIALEPGV